MRIAILSDIHGNLTAFEAVLKDLSQTAPDLTFHLGDLTDSGAHPTEILDHIRHLNWRGLYGNTDELLFRPESLKDFAAPLPHLQPMFHKIEEMAAWTRHQLGPERLAWLSQLPATIEVPDGIHLMHASPTTAWRTVADEELPKPLAIYGHTHKPFIRPNVANPGSVGQSLDGDPRASYMLIDNGTPTIRRVSYSMEKELTALKDLGLPHAAWIAKILQSSAIVT